MKIDHLCHVNFTWAEVQGLLADEVEYHANNEVAGSPRNLQLLELANNARRGHSYVEFAGSKEDGVVLVVDGVAFTETLGENDG